MTTIINNADIRGVESTGLGGTTYSIYFNGQTFLFTMAGPTLPTSPAVILCNTATPVLTNSCTNW
jgi:hypothetical protein